MGGASAGQASRRRADATRATGSSHGVVVLCGVGVAVAVGVSVRVGVGETLGLA